MIIDCFLRLRLSDFPKYQKPQTSEIRVTIPHPFAAPPPFALPCSLKEPIAMSLFTGTKLVRKLGSSGPEVFPLALGCMGMSGMYGPADEAESLATIHAAVDAGVNLIDTGD